MMKAAKIVGTDQDNRRLLESRYDLRAVSDVSLLTPSEAARAHVQESAQTLADGREALRQAMLTQSREHNETDQARLSAYDLIAECADYYAYVRGEVSNRLFNLPKSARSKLGDVEMAAREKTFQQFLGEAPGSIRLQVPERQLDLLTQVTGGMATDKRLSAFNLHDELGDLTTRAARMVEDLGSERDEDKQAMTALVLARAQFDTAASAHAKLIESVLTAQKRIEEWGRFTKAQDAAYAARRRAQSPITDEPDADELLSDVAQPPEAPPPA